MASRCVGIVESPPVRAGSSRPDANIWNSPKISVMMRDSFARCFSKRPPCQGCHIFLRQASLTNQGHSSQPFLPLLAEQGWCFFAPGHFPTRHPKRPCDAGHRTSEIRKIASPGSSPVPQQKEVSSNGTKTTAVVNAHLPCRRNPNCGTDQSPQPSPGAEPAAPLLRRTLEHMAVGASGKPRPSMRPR